MNTMIKALHRTALGVPVGLLSGAAVALFLYLLNQATEYRSAHLDIVWLLPIAGLVLGAMIKRWGGPVRSGNNLVIDSIHTECSQIPRRTAPAVLLGTVATHLFGGSAGREGAAVQIGATLADELAHKMRLPRHLRSELLCAGVAGGFAAAFGTPLAGIVFALEVTRAGRAKWKAAISSTSSAVVANFVAKLLGGHHTLLPEVAVPALTGGLILKLSLLALAIAATTIVFIETTHWLKRSLERIVSSLPIRMFIGGCLIVALWRLMGTDDYLGLGTHVILESFTSTDLAPWTFAVKLLFTAVTLGSGYLGGEVVPLFFMGATLGNALAAPLGIPLDLAVGVGLASTFAAAANAPVALSFLAAELMGPAMFPAVLLVSYLAFSLTGNRSIYTSQCEIRPLRKARYGSKGDKST